MTSQNSFAISSVRLSAVLLTAFAAIILLPEAANAQSIGFILCNGVALIRSDIARGIATLAVCSLGIGAMFGKVSWGLAILVATGIATIYGGGTLIIQMTQIANSGC